MKLKNFHISLNQETVPCSLVYGPASSPCTSKITHQNYTYLKIKHIPSGETVSIKYANMEIHSIQNRVNAAIIKHFPNTPEAKYLAQEAYLFHRTPLPTYNPEEFGYIFQVGLRKLADSKAATLWWYHIHTLIDLQAWSSISKEMANTLQNWTATPDPEATLYQALRDTLTAALDTKIQELTQGVKTKDTPDTVHTLKTIALTVDYLSDDDMCAALGYIME